MRRITKAIGMLHFVPDSLFLKMAYRLEIGRRLSLRAPQTLNEKLQWLKLYGGLERFSRLADKWTAREQVKKVLGEEYLVPALGVYKSAADIPWAQLPPPYVAKCTHGSHCGVICLDAAGFDAQKAQADLDRWLRRDWFWFGREPVYLGIEPRVLVEKFIGSGGKLPDDYKIMCFHGEPRVVQVHEKAGGTHRIGFYSVDGRRLDLYKEGYPVPEAEALDGDTLAALLNVAAPLAQSVDAPYVRVDLYRIEGRIYFSEFTFFDSSGFRRFLPEGADAYLGDFLSLEGAPRRRRGEFAARS